MGNDSNRSRRATFIVTVWHFQRPQLSWKPASTYVTHCLTRWGKRGLLDYVWFCFGTHSKRLNSFHMPPIFLKMLTLPVFLVINEESEMQLRKLDVKGQELWAMLGKKTMANSRHSQGSRLGNREAFLDRKTPRQMTRMRTKSSGGSFCSSDFGAVGSPGGWLFSSSFSAWIRT